jgi:flagellar protein FliO/FliZ
MLLDIAQYLLSFGLVIGLLLALLWALKKIQAQGGLKRRSEASRIQIVETASVGARQKVMLIRMDDQDLLLGITPTEIRTLHTVQGQPNSTQEWLRRRQP